MDEFHTKMAAVSVAALWEQENRHNRPPETAQIWHWDAMNPLIDEAVKQTDMTNAERRVLILQNPNLASVGRTGAAINLTVNLQVLMPGEKARPHRHTMHALRFALEGDGAETIVDGKVCKMLPGDMILTPGWTWHEHRHEGKTRSVWVDALDVPMHTYMETGVFEPGPARDSVVLPPDAAFAPGFTPDTPAAAQRYSPLFRYPWDAAVKALEALPPASDGSRRLRYTNPVTGGAVLSTIDCYLLGLGKDQETRAYRTNSNCVCVVMEGEGSTRIGDETVTWGPKDIFSLPHDQWISHKARTAPARIFQITDRETLRRLDYLRDELRQ
ncbi:MAG TPA: cupin domain-containing protein [Stellaceae bacterium]|nr:cupin domain-containing protein [Stellaceae bacterium]